MSIPSKCFSQASCFTRPSECHGHAVWFGHTRICDHVGCCFLQKQYLSQLAHVHSSQVVLPRNLFVRISAHLGFFLLQKSTPEPACKCQYQAGCFATCCLSGLCTELSHHLRCCFPSEAVFESTCQDTYITGSNLHGVTRIRYLMSVVLVM